MRGGADNNTPRTTVTQYITAVAKLKSNIIYNFLGSGWQGVLTLAVTPVQVQILGIEAFGLIGLITVLQVLLGSLDFGISASITKIISSDHSKDKAETANAINTASTMYWVIAVLIALLLWLSSEKIAQVWLTNTKLDAATITFSIEVIAVYLGLRWPVAFYSGVISGLQRMDILNLLKTGAHTLRLVGGVVVLLITPSLIAFLFWFAVCAALELCAFAIAAYKLMPLLRIRPYFQFESWRNIWRYSLGMNLIAMTALLLSQADRVIISKLLSLEVLGIYSVAYNASIAISLIQTAINSASFPSFSHSFTSNRHTELVSSYNKASQLMGACIALPTFMLIFFGEEIIQLWINTKIAGKVAPTMAYLSFGFYLNSLVSTAYVMAIACGKPNLPLKTNALALVMYIPALIFLIPIYGTTGAALAYIVLNFYYIIKFVPLVQSESTGQSMWQWLSSNLLPFFFTGVAAFGGWKLILLVTSIHAPIAISLAVSTVMYAVLSWFLLSEALRASFKALIKYPKV